MNIDGIGEVTLQHLKELHPVGKMKYKDALMPMQEFRDANKLTDREALACMTIAVKLFD